MSVPALRLVFWETTAACNLHCVHCRRLENRHEPAKTELTTDEGRSLIEAIASFARPILVFSGGEPLVRPDILDLARFAADRGLPTALASNGTLIDEKTAGAIRQAGLRRVSVSLDGADPETHDTFRKLPGSFQSAVRGLRCLQAAGVSTQVNCTMARHNAGQLEAVLRLAETCQADAVHYFLLVPVGCGQQIAAEQMLDAEQIEHLLGRIFELSLATKLHVKATCAPHYYRIVRQESARRGLRPPKRPPPIADGARPAGRNNDMAAMTRGCLAGTAVCFISHDGHVFPCGYLPVSAGNVRTGSLKHIWRDSDVFARLRDPARLSGKCGRCEFVHVCGGCRARAFHRYGDFLAEEPYCLYQPARRAPAGHTSDKPSAPGNSTDPAAL